MKTVHSPTAAGNSVVGPTEPGIRRLLLKAVGSVFVFPALARGLPAAGSSGDDSPDWPLELAHYTGSENSSVEIGLACISQHGGDTTREWVVESIEHLERRGRLNEPRVSVRNQIRQDFVDGRAVEVRGWILSTTEASACVLAAMRSGTLRMRNTGRPQS